MNNILEKVSFSNLFIMALMLGLAPFYPIPHSIEKLNMLINGELKKIIDIFDLIFHTSPLFIIIIKFLISKNNES